MTNALTRATYAVLLSLVPWSAAYAQVGRSISVTGQAEVRVTPSLVNIVFGVETRNRNLTVAREENDKRVQAVIKSSQILGVSQKDIQTDYIQVQPRYDDSNSGIVLQYYIVRKTVVVNLRDVTKFERCLTGGLESGANYVLGVQFLTSELKKYREEARSRAILAAKEKATALARELGARVGKIISIQDYGSGAPWNYYNNSWDGFRSGGSGMQQVSVQGPGGGPDLVAEGIALGEISISAAVSVNFELEPL